MHVKVIRLNSSDAVFYQDSHAHCMYVILHGSVSVHLRKNGIIIESMEANDGNDDKKMENNLEKKLEEIEKKEEKEKEKEKEKPFVHPQSWEERHFDEDQPNTRVDGTLSNRGGKYLVTLHAGQAFGEQALASSDDLKDTPRSKFSFHF